MSGVVPEEQQNRKALRYAKGCQDLSLLSLQYQGIQILQVLQGSVFIWKPERLCGIPSRGCPWQGLDSPKESDSPWETQGIFQSISFGVVLASKEQFQADDFPQRSLKRKS